MKILLLLIPARAVLGAVNKSVIPKISCYKGEPRDDACVYKEYMKPLEECTTKHAVIQDGLCHIHRYTPPTIKCPPDYENYGNKCEKLEKTPAQFGCMEDFHMNGKNECEQQITHSVVLECPYGYKLHGVSCTRNSKVKPLKICPAATTLIHDVCHKIDKILPEEVCPNGFDFIDKHKFKQLSILGLERIKMSDEKSSRSLNNVDKLCAKLEYSNSLASCPKSYSLEKTECIKKTDITQPVLSCKEGQLKGKKCEAVETKHPDLSCRKGFKIERNKCVQILEESPIKSCEKGYKLLENGTCVKEFIKKTTYTCPKNSLFDGKVCFKLHKVPIEKVCPKDYELSHDNKCMKSVYKQVEIVCPKGYTYVDNHCQHIEIISPELKCPKESILTNSLMCEFKEIQKPSFICKKGQLSGNTCIEHIYKPLIGSCPKGYHYEDKFCYIHKQVKAEKHCTVGKLIHDKCEVISVETPIKLCPKNFIMTSDYKCMKVNYLKPDYLCPEGHKLLNGMCYPDYGGHNMFNKKEKSHDKSNYY